MLSIPTDSFNSIKVQLEQCQEDLQEAIQSCFNSIKVQLEPKRVGWMNVCK